MVDVGTQSIRSRGVNLSRVSINRNGVAGAPGRSDVTTADAREQWRLQGSGEKGKRYVLTAHSADKLLG